MQSNAQAETGPNAFAAEAFSDDAALREALRDSDCGVFWLDHQLHVRRANGAFARYTGRSEDELVDACISHLDPEWPHGAPDETFATLRSKISAGHSARLRRPDGTTCPVHVHLNLLNLGGFESLFGVAVDTRDRHAAEDALRASEARYRAVTSDQTEYIVRVTPQMIVKFCNPAYARLVDGGHPEEIVGCSIRELICEEDVDWVMANVSSLTPDNPVVVNEYLVPTPDGAPSWVSWVVRALFEPDASGEMQLQEYQAVGRDVTESRVIRETLARTEARYRSLVEDSPELVSRWLPDGCLTFANRAYREFFGLSDDDAIGHNVLSNHDEDARAKIHAAIGGMTAESPVAKQVLCGRRQDGLERELEWVQRGFFDADGELIEVQSVGRDVTERLEAQNRLVESERRHRAVLDDLAEMVNRFRPEDGLITYANRAFLQAKSRPGEQIVGRMTIYDHLSEEAVDFARAQLATVTPSQPSVTALLPLPGPEGATRWEEWTNRALYAPPDPCDDEAPRQILEFQSVGRDVTAEIAARVRREEREKAIAELSKLTPRERQVLRAVSEGVTNKVIASRLGIAERTVEKHRGSAMRKLGVRSAAELVRAAIAAEQAAEEQTIDAAAAARVAGGLPSAPVAESPQSVEPRPSN